jgi:type VI secretion system protein ImpM
MDAWDSWLQACLRRSQQALGPGWHDNYLTMPAWRFALPAGVCGPATLAGVFVPSVDGVGRCFPLVIAQELPPAADPVSVATDAVPWFEAAEELAIAALGEAFELAALDRPLPAVALPSANVQREATTAHPVGCWVELPMLSTLPAALRQASCLGQRSALWWTGGGVDFRPSLAITAGLVAPYAFAALLDGNWAGHGWDRSEGEAPTEVDVAWDREG